MKLFETIVASALLVACGTSDPTPRANTQPVAPPVESEPVAEEEPAPAPDPFEQFGDPLSTKIATVDFAEIVAAPETFDGKEIITNGTVRASCQKRGCWMEVRPDAERAGASATVRFKDYGFFMPYDSQGARVRFQATVEVAILTKGEVLEMEAEGGTVGNKRPDGSASAILLVASGVEMRGRKKVSK